MINFFSKPINMYELTSLLSDYPWQVGIETNSLQFDAHMGNHI